MHIQIPIILKGVIIGFSIAAPIGPVGILCIRRSLAKGALYGFVSGLGTATADAAFAIIALFGAGLVVEFFNGNRFLLQGIGSLFLIYLGVRILSHKLSPKIQNKIGKRDLLKDFLSTFFITCTNPMTLISLTAIFAGIDVLANARSSSAQARLVIGIFLGSALRWIILSHGVCFFERKTNKSILKRVNTISGVMLIVFACLLLLNLLFF